MCVLHPVFIVVARNCDPKKFSGADREPQRDISAAVVPSDPPVTAPVLQLTPPVHHASAAATRTHPEAVGDSASGLPQFAAGTIQGSAAAAAAGVIPTASETGITDSSRGASAGTEIQSERRGSDSRSSVASPTRPSRRDYSNERNTEPMPRPPRKRRVLGHDPESEDPPPYHQPTINIMPGTRVGSLPPVVSTTQLEESPSDALVDDGEVGGGAIGNDAVVHGDGTIDEGQMILARASEQHGDATAQANSTDLRQTSSVNSLPSSRRASSGGLDVVEAVVGAAHALAGQSTIPGVSEAANLVSILVRLVTDHQDVTREIESRVKRCRSIIFMLERAGKVLGKVRQHVI